MTALINDLTSTSLNSTLGSTLNIFVILIFFGILLIREFIRATGDPRAEAWIQSLNIAAYPMLIVFATVIFLRFSLIFTLHVLEAP